MYGDVEVRQGTFTRNADGTRSNTLVQFSEEPVLNEAKSQAAGRPIYDSIEMHSVSFPGNNLTEFVGPVTDAVRAAYPEQYAHFKKGNSTTVVTGTPLSAWPSLNKAMVREFQALNIHSVEQLATVDDYAISRMGMGGRMWRERAKTWLAAADDNAETDRIVCENERLKALLEASNKQLAEVGALCQQMQMQMTAMQNAQRPEVPTLGALAQSFAAPPMESLGPMGGSIADGGDWVEPVKRGPGRPRKSEVRGDE